MAEWARRELMAGAAGDRGGARRKKGLDKSAIAE